MFLYNKAEYQKHDVDKKINNQRAGSRDYVLKNSCFIANLHWNERRFALNLFWYYAFPKTDIKY